MTIRCYQASDFPSIVRIYNASKLDELKFEAHQHVLLPLETDHKRRSDLLSANIYVYAPNEIKGYAAVSENLIQSLYVHPEHRCQGIGRALLEHALQHIKGRAHLYVVKSNVISKQLYHVYGFVDIDESKVDYNGISVTINTMEQTS